MGHVFGLRQSPAIIVAVLALVAAVAGTAVAGPGAVTSAITKAKVKKIANKQIDKRLPWKTGDIADGAVTTPKLANGAVDTAKLADGAVTASKFGPVIERTENSPATTDSDGTQNGAATSVNQAGATAECAAGEKLIGGGARWADGDDGNDNLYINESYPVGNGWHAEGIVDFGAQGTAVLQAYALCLQ
jgi:hypothetical protein